MKDYLMNMCETWHSCNPDTIVYELAFGGVLVAILIIAYVIKEIRK